MEIECPHCTQNIDLGEDPPPRFSCPTCDGHIELEMKDDSVESPASTATGQGIKLPVLLGAIMGAVVLSLLVGWMIWGGDGRTTEPSPGELITGSPREPHTEAEKMTPREKAVSKALTHYWSAASVEEKLSVVRKQSDTEKRMREHYKHEILKPTGIRLLGIHEHMKNFGSAPTKSNFDIGESAPEGFVFAEYRTGTETELSRGMGGNRCDLVEVTRDSGNNIVSAEIDWESQVGWNPATSKALQAQKKTEPSIVRCKASIDGFNLSTSDNEEQMGWVSLQLDLPDDSSDLIYAAISPSFEAKAEILQKLNDGEEHHLILQISHRGQGAEDFQFIVTDYINDSWLIVDEDKHFSELRAQKFPINISDVRDSVSAGTNQPFTETANSVTFVYQKSRGLRDRRMFVATRRKTGVEFEFYILGGFDRTGDWAVINVMTEALNSSVFTRDESTGLVELLGRLGDVEQPVTKKKKDFAKNVGRFHVEAMIEVYDPHADRVKFVFSPQR